MWSCLPLGVVNVVIPIPVGKVIVYVVMACCDEVVYVVMSSFGGGCDSVCGHALL